MPVITICVIMLVLWIHYESKKTNRNSDVQSIQFWKQEQDANHTRNHNLESISYLQIPLESLPLIPDAPEPLKTLQASLESLSKTKITNLSHLTNTELKLTYGTGMFQTLSECDENFSKLTHTLDRIGSYHIEHDDPESAISFLEYAVRIKTEMSNTYVNLAALYMNQQTPEKITRLCEKVQDLAPVDRDRILPLLNLQQTTWNLS